MADGNDAFEDGPVRPRRSGNGNGGSGGGASVIDPATLAGADTSGGGSDGAGDGDDYVRNADGTVKRNKDGSPRKKRGRKAGAAKASSPHDLKASIDALTSMLGIAHSAVAAVTMTPEIELNRDEAHLLATATVPVLDMMEFTPDPRFIAVFGLVGACAQVYGPRAMLIRMRRAEERAQRARPVRGTDAPPNPMGATSYTGGEAPFGESVN